jgi:PAS domain-containing protein
MLAQEIDFHEIFKVNSTAMLLLTADLVIVDANDEFLSAVGRPLDDLLGHHIFDKFPKMPQDPGGEPKWTALEQASASGEREVRELARYDIEDPGRPGVYEERYWSAVVTPIHGLDGQIEVLELSLRELTPVITQFRALRAEEG